MSTLISNAVSIATGTGLPVVVISLPGTTTQSTPPTLQSRIEAIADALLNGAAQGTWPSGPGAGTIFVLPNRSGYSGASYLVGCYYAALARPETYGSTNILGNIAQFAYTQQENGRVWDAVTPELGYAGPGGARMQIWSDVSAFVGLVWVHWKLTGELTAFTTYKDACELAMSSISMADGLWVSDGSSPCWEWEDSCFVTGHPAQSVELYQAASRLSEMYQAASLTDPWGPQLAGLKSAIVSNLWDDSKGLLWGSTELGGLWNDGSDHTGASGLHNVPLTALAILCGILDGSNATAARAAIRSGLVGGAEYVAGRGHERHGFIRYYPLPEKQHSWNSGETDAYGSGDNYYINGNWAVFAAWVAKAIQPDFPTEAVALMQRLADYQDDDPINGCLETVNAITGAVGGGANALGFLSAILQATFYTDKF